MFINEYCNTACTLEDGVITNKSIGNTWTTTIDGFPVDMEGGRFYLYVEIFNDSDKMYDDRSLVTPWLESMQLEVINWGWGERDSFGPLTSTCLVRLPSGDVATLVFG